MLGIGWDSLFSYRFKKVTFFYQLPRGTRQRDFILPRIVLDVALNDFVIRLHISSKLATGRIVRQQHKTLKDNCYLQ